MVSSVTSSCPAVHDDGEVLAIQRAEDDDRGRASWVVKASVPVARCRLPVGAPVDLPRDDEGGVERTEAGDEAEPALSWREVRLSTPGPAARAMVTPARSTESAASVFRLTDPAHAVTAERRIEGEVIHDGRNRPEQRVLPDLRVAADIHQSTLSNGLRVAIEPDGTVPIVGVSLSYDVGSRRYPGRRDLPICSNT